jgi:predicted RNase H-like HicB family nuclease
MSSTAFTVHKDMADEGVVWWAESDQVPGFSAAADTLDDLCRLISEAVSLRGGSGSAFSLEFPAAIDVPAPTDRERAGDHRA